MRYCIKLEELQKTAVRLKKKVDSVKVAHDSITGHQKYLAEKLETYRVYLNNVRGGNQQSHAGQKKTPFKSKKVEFMHPDLISKGVILRASLTNPKHESYLKDLHYVFTSAPGSVFQISVIYPTFLKNFEILDKPFRLQFDDLLQMREQNHTDYNISMKGVQLNMSVNLLINMLNKQFHMRKG